MNVTFTFIATCCRTEPLEDRLANFIIRYRPPYVAQVLEGVDTPTGASSLSLDEILTIHTVVRLKRIKMTNSKGKRFYLPVDNSARVEIVPKTRTRLSKGLGSQNRRLPKFLRALRDTPGLDLRNGDVLDPIVKETAYEEEANSVYSRAETLQCKVLFQSDKEIRLALHSDVPFESFEEFDPRRYSLRYVVDNIAFPIAVRFIGDVEFNPDVKTPLIGEFRFEEIVEESIVVATTKLHDHFIIIKLPVDLEVTLFPIRKLRCDAGYIEQYWECLQREIDKLEKQITSFEKDLLPESFFQKNMLPVISERNANIDSYVAELITRVCLSPDTDSDGCKAMGYSSSKRLEECGLEGGEDHYEEMEPSMLIPEGAEDDYESMTHPSSLKCTPVQEGREHFYEAVGPSIAYGHGEGLPYSRARSGQRNSAKTTQEYREKALYSSLNSFRQNSSSNEISPRVYQKLQRKSTNRK